MNVLLKELEKKGYLFSVVTINGKDIIIISESNKDVYLSSLTTLPDGVQFNNQGSVYLRSLTTLPDGVQFNNQGYVDLSSLTTLPDGVQFNNQGSVYLSSLTEYDELKAGREKRKLYVVNCKNGLKLSLGCFCGNEQECIDAISKKYSGEEKEKYLSKVKNSFDKARIRYAEYLTF